MNPYKGFSRDCKSLKTSSQFDPFSSLSDPFISHDGAIINTDWASLLSKDAHGHSQHPSFLRYVKVTVYLHVSLLAGHKPSPQRAA